METVDLIFLWITLPLLLLIFIAFLFRNNKVLRLKKQILHASHQYHLERIDEWEPAKGFIGYNELPSYENMVYSMRPLNPKSYLSDETYEILKPYLGE